MPIGKDEMREYQCRRRMAETLGQGCGISWAEKCHRVNIESPGLNLCAGCAGVLDIALEYKGREYGRGSGIFADLIRQLRNALEELPGEKVCAGCIADCNHLIFVQHCYWGRLFPGEGAMGVGPVAPQSRIPIAALPAGVTAPGEAPGRMVRQ